MVFIIVFCTLCMLGLIGVILQVYFNGLRRIGNDLLANGREFFFDIRFFISFPFRFLTSNRWIKFRIVLHRLRRKIQSKVGYITAACLSLAVLSGFIWIIFLAVGHLLSKVPTTGIFQPIAVENGATAPIPSPTTFSSETSEKVQHVDGLNGWVLLLLGVTLVIVAYRQFSGRQRPTENSRRARRTHESEAEGENEQQQIPEKKTIFYFTKEAFSVFGTATASVATSFLNWILRKHAMAATICAIFIFLIILRITAHPLYTELVRTPGWWGLVFGLTLTTIFLVPVNGKVSGVAKFFVILLLGLTIAFTFNPVIQAFRKTGYGDYLPTYHEISASFNKAADKMKPAPKKATDRIWSFHWEKSQGVNGLRPELREDRYNARVVKEDGVVTRIDVSFLHKGATVHCYMNWDRSENAEHGTWSQKEPEDHGTWKGRWVTPDLFSGSFTNKFGEVINMDLTPAD